MEDYTWANYLADISNDPPDYALPEEEGSCYDPNEVRDINGKTIS